MRFTILCFCLMMAGGTMFLGGCGIKPGDVDPPQGKDKDYFPHTYPAPNTTDPNPERYVPR